MDIGTHGHLGVVVPQLAISLWTGLVTELVKLHHDAVIQGAKANSWKKSIAYHHAADVSYVDI